MIVVHAHGSTVKHKDPVKVGDIWICEYNLSYTFITNIQYHTISYYFMKNIDGHDIHKTTLHEFYGSWRKVQ